MGSPILLDIPGTYALKPRFQAILRPLVRELAAHRLRANHLTIAACVLSVGFGSMLTFGDSKWFAFLPLVLLIRMALNAMDGMLAREFGQQSRLGAYLNELTDVISDAFLYLPFARFSESAWMFATILLIAISEMAGAIAVSNGASRRYDGPMSKSDRAVVFGALGLWIGIAGALPAAVAAIFPIAMTVLLSLTAINRVRSGMKEAQQCVVMTSNTLKP
jgi:CDP-diacylglycerol--glycerol-3-phosphate 3-phosphatidyltransferase